MIKRGGTLTVKQAWRPGVAMTNNEKKLGGRRSERKKNIRWQTRSEKRKKQKKILTSFEKAPLVPRREALKRSAPRGKNTFVESLERQHASPVDRNRTQKKDDKKTTLRRHAVKTKKPKKKERQQEPVQ